MKTFILLGVLLAVANAKIAPKLETDSSESLGTYENYEFRHFKLGSFSFLLVINHRPTNGLSCVVIQSYTNGWMDTTLVKVPERARINILKFLVAMFNSNKNDMRGVSPGSLHSNEVITRCAGHPTTQYIGPLDGQEIVRAGRWEVFDFTRMGGKKGRFLLAVGQTKCYLIKNFKQVLVKAYANLRSFKVDLSRQLFRPRAKLVALRSYADEETSKKCDGKRTYIFNFREKKTSIKRKSSRRRSRYSRRRY